MTDPLPPVHGEQDPGRARSLITVLPAEHDGVVGELFVGDVRARVLRVVEGRGALEDGEHGRQELTDGDVVVVPAGRVHRRLAGDTDAMTHLSVTTSGLHHLLPRPTSP